MKVLVLNGSPRLNGNVAKTLDMAVSKYTKSTDEIIRYDVSKLNFAPCVGCMVCRSKTNCGLPEDDGHKIAKDITECDMIFVGTPVYWGNMNGKLKMLFDRLVGVLMGESKLGIPVPLHKGKKAVIVTSCTTPFPFNYICGQSSGAVRAVKEILKSSGFGIKKVINLSGTKKVGAKCE